MKKIILLVLMLVNLVLVNAASGELIVGMELEYPPFETIDKDGNPSGVSVELANLLSEKLDKKLKIENISYGGLIPALRSGKIDVIISSMSINESRARSVDFSVPYASSPLVMLAYKDSDVFIYDPQSIVRCHKKYPETTRTIMDPLPGIGDWGMAVQKGNSVLLEDINEFIETAKLDGTFDRIRKEYLLEETKEFEEETGMKFFF